MRALGLTCGIGSMLIGARAAGFEVVGNIEWRKYYHVRDDQGRNTFTENFPGAFMVHSIDELTDEQIEGLKGVDLVMGHPDCGAWSQLNSVQKNYKNRKKKSEDLPIFVEGIRRIQPRFFVMDNLPQCFQGLSIEEWVGSLPNYDLSIEWISNYHYGNIQLNRRRLFIVGSKKEEKYSFIPGECWHDTCVKDQLNDLPLQEDLPRINHCHVDPDDNSKWPTLDGDGAIFWTFRELAHYLMTLKEGANGYYRNKQGEIKKKVGRYRTYWNKHSHVITGGSIGVPSFVMWDVYHPLTGYPLTIRERARIQGCPDEFIFFGPEEFLVRQTGKFMPVQFCTYVARQIAAHIQGQPFETSGERLIKPNPHIDAAKKWYCENVGYGDNQERVCEVCWMTCEKEASDDQG